MIRIQITQEDLDRGVPGDGYNCPIARAVRRSHPEWRGIHAGFYGLDFVDEQGRLIEYASTDTMQHFVRQFDRTAGRGMKPRTMVIR
jgi:hypothetical protein